MVKIKYQAYVSGKGWQDPVENWQIAGTVGEHKAIEAVRVVSLETDDNANLGVAGRGLVQGLDWNSEDCVNGADIGSTGLDRPLEAIKLGLFGDDADKYDIWYRLHVENIGFMPPVRNFEPSGTQGQNLQAEAIQIIIQKKSENFWYASDTMVPFEKFEQEINPVTPVEQSEDTLRKLIIDTAASHIGESGAEFQARMGIPGQDWCAAFASCIFIDCGLRNLIPVTTYVPTTQEWAKGNGKWKGVNSGYMPQSGDLVIYDFNSNGTGDHIGIVHSARSARNISAVEGNTGSSPTKVMMRGRTSGILGYVQIL